MLRKTRKFSGKFKLFLGNPDRRMPNPVTGGPPPRPPTTENPPPDWRKTVNTELREHLVKKLVSAIFPQTDQNSQHQNDERMTKLYNFARKVCFFYLKD